MRENTLQKRGTILVREGYPEEIEDGRKKKEKEGETDLGRVNPVLERGTGQKLRGKTQF